MKVVYCGGLNWMKSAPEHLGIQQGMESLGWDWHIVDPILGDPDREQIASEINQFKPDLVIYGNTNPLTKNVCLDVSSDTKQIFWMLDYRALNDLKTNGWYDWLTNKDKLSAIFINDGTTRPYWQEAFGVNVYYAPHACYIPDELTYSDTLECDLVFVGGHDRRHSAFFARTELLSQIEKLSGIPISLFNESERTARDFIFQQIPVLYHSSKLVLDISHFWNNWGYCSSRFWHTAGFGSCSISRYFPGCTKFFSKSLKAYFETPQEAADLITRVLENENERERMKRQISKYAWDNHSYKIRFQQMMLCLETGKQVPMF
jgi:hypothetical protein